jgi:hypothetical protein
VQIHSSIIRNYRNAPLGICITWQTSVTLRVKMNRFKWEFRLAVNFTILGAVFLFSWGFFCVTARSGTDKLPTWIDQHEKPYVSWNVRHDTRTTLSVHVSKHMRLVRSPFWYISFYDRLITAEENKLSVNWTRSARLGGMGAVYCVQLLYRGGHGFNCMKIEFYEERKTNKLQQLDIYY